MAVGGRTELKDEETDLVPMSFIDFCHFGPIKLVGQGAGERVREGK